MLSQTPCKDLPPLPGASKALQNWLQRRLALHDAAGGLGYILAALARVGFHLCCGSSRKKRWTSKLGQQSAPQFPVFQLLFSLPASRPRLIQTRNRLHPDAPIMTWCSRSA